jgi:hypothetical protein
MLNPRTTAGIIGSRIARPRITDARTTTAITGPIIVQRTIDPAGTAMGGRGITRQGRMVTLLNGRSGGPRTSASSVEPFALALWRQGGATKQALCELRLSFLVAAPPR